MASRGKEKRLRRKALGIAAFNSPTESVIFPEPMRVSVHMSIGSLVGIPDNAVNLKMPRYKIGDYPVPPCPEFAVSVAADVYMRNAAIKDPVVFGANNLVHVMFNVDELSDFEADVISCSQNITVDLLRRRAAKNGMLYGIAWNHYEKPQRWVVTEISPPVKESFLLKLFHTRQGPVQNENIAELTRNAMVNVIDFDTERLAEATKKAHGLIVDNQLLFPKD